MNPFCKLLFILTFFSASSVCGQILIGPVVGSNYSFTSFSDKDLKDIYKVSGVFGYHVGGHLAFKVRKRFFLQTSLIYSTKGRLLTDHEGSVKSKTQYNFIELPAAYTVDFKVHTGNSREFKYFIGLGPNISYWLGGKGTISDPDLKENHIDQLSYKVSFKENDPSQNEDNMYVEKPNRLQFGLNFVAGLAFEPADRQRVMVTLRYELGHTYLAKSNGVLSQDYFQDPLQSTNQGFRFSVAYLYDLKTSDRNKGRSTIDKKSPK